MGKNDVYVTIKRQATFSFSIVATIFSA